jgi:2'-5' RNA ligase
MAEPETLRLFVAIELPGEVREALGRLQHELQRRGLENLRWVRPEGIHLTLKFLGETPAERVPDIEAALFRAVNAVAPHKLALNGLGTFGGSRPRVLWLDLTGNLDAIGWLQDRVETETEELGFQRDARPWAPHLTLARVHPETAREIVNRLPAALDAVRPPSDSVPVREVSLMRSTLRPGGAVYERLAAFPLRGA